jgi:hypothetical protein
MSIRMHYTLSFSSNLEWFLSEKSEKRENVVLTTLTSLKGFAAKKHQAFVERTVL